MVKLTTKKTEEKKKIQSTKVAKTTRTKKNKRLYGQKVVIKNKKLHKGIIIALILSVLVNGFTVFHFITYNHHKVKEVTKVKEVVPENIVFLGDSITWMYDLDKYYHGKKVVNSGGDGNTTSDILNDMNERIYRYNPSKIFILIGTNDIIYDKTKDEIVDNIEKIIEGIQKNRPTCKIYLESIYPINDTKDKKISMEMVKNRTNKLINEINKEIEKTCNQLNVTYIDVHNELINKEGRLKIEYTKEGLHLSEKGYDKVTNIIKKYL